MCGKVLMCAKGLVAHRVDTVIYCIINSVYTISKYIASYLGRWTLYCMIMQPSAMVVTHYVHTTVKELHGIAMA
jgi:hypothetical protein